MVRTEQYGPDTQKNNDFCVSGLFLGFRTQLKQSTLRKKNTKTKHTQHTQKKHGLAQRTLRGKKKYRRTTRKVSDKMTRINIKETQPCQARNC